MATVQTERFFDGTRWEATCPVEWMFRQDRTVDGFPHVFEAAPNLRLQIGVRRDVWVNYGAGITRADIDSEPLRIAYVMTLEAARSDTGSSLGNLLGSARAIGNFDSKLHVHRFAAISGFTYHVGNGWAGYFCAPPWMLFARFTGSPADEQRAVEALAILESLRFVRTENAV